MSEAESAITALIDLMVRLRDPKSGCPWDQKQTFATVAPYTIEEAYEVADAIERGRDRALRHFLRRSQYLGGDRRHVADSV